jgi:hypothetical protein
LPSYRTSKPVLADENSNNFIPVTVPKPQALMGFQAILARTCGTGATHGLHRSFLVLPRRELTRAQARLRRCERDAREAPDAQNAQVKISKGRKIKTSASK